MRILMAVFLVAMMTLAFPFPFGAAQAQDKGASATTEDAGDMNARLNLAKVMHEIKPARQQIDVAIEMVSKRLPVDQREDFVGRMQKIFDYDKLEELSIKAMAEVFTEKELQKMVDYYGSKEAISADKKMPVYQSVMQPEITKMLDEALLEVRTGGASDVTEPEGNAADASKTK